MANKCLSVDLRSEIMPLHEWKEFIDELITLYGKDAELTFESEDRMDAVYFYIEYEENDG